MILTPNNITSPSQNERLHAIGLTKQYADENLMPNTMFDKFDNYGFSLTRLIDLLPDYVVNMFNGNPLEYNLEMNKYRISYCYYDDYLFTIEKRKDIGLINNAYIEMAIETFEYLYNNNIWKITDFFS